MDTSVDYYSVLGIKPTATVDDIKRAYRQMVFRFHPDRNPDSAEAADKFTQVRDAYAVLSDALKRRVYDGVRHPAGAEESAKPAEAEPEEAPPAGDSGSASAFNFNQEFKQKVEPEPKCPSCSVVGIDHLVLRKGRSASAHGKHFILAPFNVVLCSACGHVYGITGNSN